MKTLTDKLHLAIIELSFVQEPCQGISKEDLQKNTYRLLVECACEGYSTEEMANEFSHYLLGFFLGKGYGIDEYKELLDNLSDNAKLLLDKLNEEN